MLATIFRSRLKSAIGKSMKFCFRNGYVRHLGRKSGIICICFLWKAKFPYPITVQLNQLNILSSYLFSALWGMLRIHHEVLTKQWFESLLVWSSFYENIIVLSARKYVYYCTVCNLMVPFNIWAPFSAVLGRKLHAPLWGCGSYFEKGCSKALTVLFFLKKKINFPHCTSVLKVTVSVMMLQHRLIIIKNLFITIDIN
jgi:hypothetical protein